MAKYNVLMLIPGKDTGLSYHRQLIPNGYLARTDEDFRVVRTNTIDGMTDDQLKEFQIVQFLREIPNNYALTLSRLKDLGIKTVFDIDDLWEVGKTHNMYNKYKDGYVGKMTAYILAYVDHITTTHELLAKKIKEVTKVPVTVLVNAIDPEDEQWKIRKIENPLVRVGWIGGIHHKPDVELMRYSLAKLYADKTLRDKFQVCLGGFNVISSFSEQNIKELKALGADVEYMKTLSFAEMLRYCDSKRIQFTPPEYCGIEQIFTDNYKGIWDKDYKNYLSNFSPMMEHYSFDKPYRRLWGTNVFNYGNLYNDIDVALIPLVDNEFNNCKSQLKIIEAGFMKKAVIVSEVHPYTIDCVNRENCLTVRPNMNMMDWFLHAKRMITEPELREDMAEAMYETVKDKYHIKTPTEIRKDLYKKLCD